MYDETVAASCEKKPDRPQENPAAVYEYLQSGNADPKLAYTNLNKRATLPELPQRQEIGNVEGYLKPVENREPVREEPQYVESETKEESAKYIEIIPDDRPK